VRALLQEAATARVGLSPPYAKLADTAWAVGLAAVARGSSPPGAATVRGLDDRAIPTLVSAGRTVAELVAKTILGPVLDLDPAERALLLENLEAWFDAGGSASEAGHRLYCHRNTVRNRLQRVEQLTGRSTASPQATSELYAALTAVRLLGLAPIGPDQGSG
jgi:DNA-binding PucR family transcriptional regulator